MRLIDADACIDYIRNNNQHAWEALAYAPTIDAEPVKHGVWRVIIKTEGEIQARCSECKMVYFLGMGRSPNYCPNCGAKMDGDMK